MKVLEWINNQIEWLKNFFNDVNGKPRLSAFLRLAVVLVWLNSYIRATYLTQQLPAISWEHIVLLLLCVGITTVEGITKLLTTKNEVKSETSP